MGNLAECENPLPEPTEAQEVEEARILEARQEKKVKEKEEERTIAQQIVKSDGGIYGDRGSGQNDYVMPGPFICPMHEAQAMGLGPPPAPKEPWEDQDSDEEVRT